jgi:branched-subunit amino acid ABC-type transport system permease component
MRDFIIPQLLNGLTLGAVLVLIAVGLTMVFGLMGVVNFAHGSMYMLGAYFTVQVIAMTGQFWLGLIVAVLVVGAFGLLIERFLIRPLYGRDPLLQVLLTFGIAVFLREAVEIVWGSRIQVLLAPPALDGSADFFGVQYPIYRVVVLGLAAAVAGSIWLILRYTNLGLIIRAGTCDRVMVSALGINIGRVFTGVFVAGSMLAALAGALVGPLRTVTPDMGNDVIAYAFVAVIVGGLGSFPGAIAGAMLVGMAELTGAFVLPSLAKATVDLIVAITMIARPAGLFGDDRSAA